MFKILFDYFATTLSANIPNTTSLYAFFIGNQVSIFGVNFPLYLYFSFLFALIGYIVIIVLACLLIKKIFNLCAHVIG